MKKYTEEELEKIQNILLNDNWEYNKELVKYTKDDELIRKTAEYNTYEDFDENTIREVYDKIIALVPEERKDEFLKKISSMHLGFMYSREMTSKYPELFAITINKLLREEELNVEHLEYIFENTDER